MNGKKSVWVQASLFGLATPVWPAPPVRRRGVGFVRVTRDPAVTRAWSESVLIGAELTQGLARALNDDQLDEIRRRLYRPTEPALSA